MHRNSLYIILTEKKKMYIINPFYLQKNKALVIMKKGNMDFFWISVISATCYWFLGFFLLNAYRTLPSENQIIHSENIPWPTLSIIIPARNEAHRITPLLESLKRQNYPELEILVVDDMSSDQTCEICISHGFKVQRIQSKPDRWNGKSYALHCGVEKTRGEMLLFLDADTELSQGALKRLISHYEEGILTMQPYHVTKKCYESFSLFPNLLVASGAFSRFSQSDKPVIFGPLILMKRNIYVQMGGYPTIAEAHVDDMALATLAHQHHCPVFSLHSNGVVRFRMYPEGLKSWFLGWSKNLAFGSTRIPPGLFLCQFFWITGMINSWIAISLGLTLNLHFLIWTYLWLSFASYGLQLWIFSKKLGNFSIWSCILYPLSFLFFLLVLGLSLFYTFYRHKVFWKNRELTTKRKGV